MNTETKNIETCLPESILAEVASVPTDPQFVSLVEESFDPLQQQAVQQAGSDAYNEVVASHKPYTFTSSVRQMKSNLILLLRRFWRFPFGSGSLRSLSDMWAHYITRLQGSETYGIPSRLDQLTDLPSAPLLVADRKISGVPDAEDGISLVHLLCDNTIQVPEILDDNQGWVLRRAIPAMTGLKKVTLGCKSMPICSLDPFVNNSGIEEGYFPELEALDNRNYEGYNSTSMFTGSTLKKLSFPKLTTLHCNNMNGRGYFRDITGHCEILMPNCNHVVTQLYTPRAFTGCSGVWKLVLGKLEQVSYLFSSGGGYTGSEFTSLIHFEIGAGTDISLPFGDWSPTNALDPTGTDLVEDPTAHPTWNNLQQFLQNFRSFIVLRLANRKTTTALTLTLSANVYNAVTGANSGWASQHTLAELGITDNDLTDLETELGITSATIYATWLDTYTGANGIHWDINKAN